VAPLLNGFHAQYPGIALELLLSDRSPDFVLDRIDVSFSERRMVGGKIISRQLAPVPQIVCASSAYVRVHGVPQHVDDLADHHCINLNTSTGLTRQWEFKIDGCTQHRQPFARHSFNDADLLVCAVCAGLGIAQLPAYQVSGLLSEGKLISCLAKYAPDDGGLYIIYESDLGRAIQIRLFVEYCVEVFATPAAN
jgi:DNA-binding transcriptional LysR family regulator